MVFSADSRLSDVAAGPIPPKDMRSPLNRAATSVRRAKSEANCIASDIVPGDKYSPSADPWEATTEADVGLRHCLERLAEQVGKRQRRDADRQVHGLALGAKCLVHFAPRNVQNVAGAKRELLRGSAGTKAL